MPPHHSIFALCTVVLHTWALGTEIWPGKTAGIQQQFTAVHLPLHIAQPYPTTQTDPVSGISALHSSGGYSVNFWMQREKCRQVNYHLVSSTNQTLCMTWNIITSFYTTHAGLIVSSFLLWSSFVQKPVWWMSMDPKQCWSYNAHIYINQGCNHDSNLHWKAYCQ